jgi:sugar phosphate isomerase/epimerase
MSPEIVMNHATFRKSLRFDAFARACAAAGMARVSVWGDELAEPRAARALLADLGLGVFGYNRAGPLLAHPDGAGAALDAARHEIDRAAALGADHVLVFPGGLAPGARGLAEARAQTVAAVLAWLDHARGCGVGLALEPLHPMLAGDRTALCTLAEANALCDDAGPGLGIVIDTHHVWWDPARDDQIAAAGAAGRIMGLHVNDWLRPTTHLLTDRGMMGDGIIDLRAIYDGARAAGYAGPVEVEIFSERWWAESPARVMALALERCAAIFGGDAP